MSRKDHTKHLGVYLDSELSFSKHIREAVMKATKGVSLLKYLSKYVSRKVLDLSYKLYVRPHLDYGEQVQYIAALLVSGCWHGINPEMLYDELGWESFTSMILRK